MGETAAITDASFATAVLESAVPVVVEFGAPWCRPCKAIEPVLEELVAASGGRLRLVSLDVDANPVVPSRYGVLSLPTVIVFRDGAVLETIPGARGRPVYERAFLRVLGP